LPGRNSVMSRALLLDATGTKVMYLQVGPNDVRALSPGIYFVREEVQGQIQAIHRVVLTR